MRLLKGKDGKIHPGKLGLLIVVIAAILIPFCTGSRGFFTLIRLHRDVNHLQQDIVATTSENAAIRDTIKALEEKDPVAVEREARNLGMIKEGETVYKVVPEK